MIAVKCPTCSSPSTVKDEYAGRVGKCKKCGDSIKIPDALKPQPAKTPTPTPVVQPIVQQAPPQIIYVERQGYNAARAIIVISSCIGVIATFLPWVSSPILTVAGSAYDGWTSLILNLAILFLALPGTPYAKIPEVCKFLIILIAIFLLGFAFYQSMKIHNATRGEESLIARAMIQTGIGIYLVGITAFVDLVAIFVANGEAKK